MDKRSVKNRLRAVRDAFGVRSVVFGRRGKALVRMREDRAVDAFLAVLAGHRLPDKAARTLAKADKGDHDLTAAIVMAARRQVAADEQEEADRKAAEGDTL
jgi:hypothetical protein